ncbi:hypothetical protein ACLWA8_01075 [Streptosporangium longisporum]|uniref:Enoyl reductase n=2 Tax=Streptosporangium longisporum TaxID=46187 RepID=A0ABN3XT67_9ACTN
MIGKMIVAGLLMLAPPATAAVSPVTAAAPVAADPEPQGTTGEAYQRGREAGVSLKDSQIVITGTGLTGKSDGYRIKRPCWYEPRGNAEERLEAERKALPDALPEQEWKRRKEALEKFEEKVGQKGTWWQRAYNSADPAGMACVAALGEPDVWAPPGTTPPNGITIEELVEIARAALTVPDPKIEINPDVKSYVNLPTWVWLGGAGETTRSVTATLPGVMSATVTATRGGIDIDSGTTGDRARVAKSGCGEGGVPYRKGADDGDDPPCGVTYLRASVDQPRGVYELTVTAVWDIEVEDDVVPFAYDPVEVGATRDVPVGEVQSTVRKTG